MTSSFSKKLAEVYDHDEEIKQVELQTKKYTSKIRLGRTIVMLLLAVTGLLVSATTYVLLRKREQINFENAYNQFSRTLGDAAISEMKRLREAVRSFGQVVEVITKETNQSWPFFDYAGIEMFAQEQLDSKGLENLQYLTRVNHSQREQWLAFESDIYERWVKSGHTRAYGNLDSLVEGGYQADILEVTDAGVYPSSEKEEYWPLAFRYPPPNSYFIVGLDISSINYDDMFASLKLLGNQTLISNVNPYIESDEEEAKQHAKFHSTLADGSSRTDFPHSFMFHPVHQEPNNSSSDIVAMVLVPIAWDASLRNLLPASVNGLVVVGRNSCGQEFSYLIEGENAYFIGNEDLHDEAYDSMETAVNLDFSVHPKFGDTAGHCTYTLSIFPSERFEAQYSTGTPLLFLIVVSCTFALMITVFFVYDRIVEQRNRKMVVDAARSNIIVSSMFPGALRDKVLLDQRKRELYRNKKATETSRSSEPDCHGIEMNREYEDSILAELYSETSVIFADIVGFTQWSSSREPFQVFKLLETLFLSFDMIAKQPDCLLFKVETTGDCYVGVSGYPHSQPDHAVRVARFARAILDSFARDIKVLSATLGPETLKLGLRIGIHSGPVTAGVLRGERARVQLFGDTMNFTSRMESTGKPWCIQASEQCAHLLKKAGKSSWITRREEAVLAKGKGTVGTYWVKQPVAVEPMTKSGIGQPLSTSGSMVDGAFGVEVVLSGVGTVTTQDLVSAQEKQL